MFRLKLDGGPSPKAEQRIKEYLRCREKVLSTVSQAIYEESARQNASISAIANLESTLPVLRKTINTSNDGLNDLEAVQDMIKKLIEFGSIPSTMNMDEPDSFQLCQKYYRSLSDYTSLSAPVIANQIKLLHSRVHLLKVQHYNMGVELEDWRRLHKLATASLGQLKSTKAGIEEEIRSVKQDLHPIRRIPPDIWIDVFKYVIDEEFSAYLQHNCNVPLRSTPHTLSHVCQLWRMTTRECKSLWRLMVGHSCPIWSTTKYNLFTDARRNSGRPQTMLVNLSQILHWRELPAGRAVFGVGASPNFARNNLGDVISSIDISRPGVSQPFTMNDKYDTLFIDMEDDAADTILKAEKFPFKQSSRLVLSSRNSLKDGNILSVLRSFRQIRSLTIQNEIPTHVPPATFSSTLPTLDYLKLAFGTFPAGFQLNGYLTETLKELHIHDNNGTSLPSPMVGRRLPNLHTLGINYPAQSFLESIAMPALTNLILYTFNFAGATPTTTAQAISTYKQLKNLRFQEWTDPSSGSDSYYGAMGALSRLAPRIPTLQSLTFDRCYVDGGALVKLFETPKEAVKVKSLTNLQEMVLSYTEGITRVHCDELKQAVGNIKVFR
ncbi:hypothetical protein FRC16_009879 [Serendipita sp. 398]|nr:hypothetical protein FRC16_009879 [Serendipita sp. 398]